MNRKLLILGCGYSAKYISKKLISEGWEIFGTTRFKANFKILKSYKIQPIYLNDFSALRTVTSGRCSILSSIPPKGQSDEGLRVFAKLLQQNADNIEWVGYLSSTGVYGDRGGEWVTEDSKRDSVTDQGKARINAENSWIDLARKYVFPLFIFRLGGIYGPKRNIFDRLEAGTVKKIFKPNQYFNRIHVEDISEAVRISLGKRELAGIYNIVDNLPTNGSDLIDEATRMIGMPPLPNVNLGDAKLSAMSLAFYSECKRVSNKKAKRVLGVSLKYPTYKEGLRSLLDNSA